MRDWFEALEEREKIFVLAAAVVIAVTVFWFGIWKPLDDGQTAAARRVETWRVSLRELQPLKNQLQGASSGQPVQADQPLVVIVDSSLRQRGLAGSHQRSQPTPTGGIRVEFENAAFDDLMLWLGDLNRQYGLIVQSGSFSLASGDAPGRVNSTLTLER
ncbi:MAG: type II secretion system protein M [Woeseiaceae bacterium]|nr:type II secretion system protein M [Woeseiaceae bacterium]